MVIDTDGMASCKSNYHTITTTNVVNSNPLSWRGVLDTTLCDKFVNDLRQDGGFLVCSTNKTDSHDITEILLKVMLNTINSLWTLSLA
jgi:hypothetical protein